MFSMVFNLTSCHVLQAVAKHWGKKQKMAGCNQAQPIPLEEWTNVTGKYIIFVQDAFLRRFGWFIVFLSNLMNLMLFRAAGPLLYKDRKILK